MLDRHGLAILSEVNAMVATHLILSVIFISVGRE